MTLASVVRNSSPTLEEFGHPADDVESPRAGSQNEAATDESCAGQSVSERFQSFARLLKLPRLTREQKRLFDRPLDDLVADARRDIESQEELDLAAIRPPSSYGPPVATANAFLDEDRPWRPRPPVLQRGARRTLWFCGASAVAALCWATLLLMPGPGPAPEPLPEPIVIRPAPIEARSYPIDQTANTDDLTVVFGDLIERAERFQLNIYTINFAEQSRPGGVVADDGQGHQAKVVDENETLPPRSVQRRTVDIPADFNAWSPNLRLREKSALAK